MQRLAFTIVYFIVLIRLQVYLKPVDLGGMGEEPLAGQPCLLAFVSFAVRSQMFALCTGAQVCRRDELYRPLDLPVPELGF